jgi:deazaflavin-dependent oxidoreductase (nitroreductase family)
MNPTNPVFREPNALDRILNKTFGFLVGLGLGLRHNYIVQVRGRRTGRLYSTPINLLEFHGKRFLVAPRGRAQWVRNAEAGGEITLKKGRKRQRFRIRVVASGKKAEILKAYLDRFKLTVQRYFPVLAGSKASAFAEIVDGYPVFELVPSKSVQEDPC